MGTLRRAVYIPLALSLIASGPVAWQAAPASAETDETIHIDGEPAPDYPEIEELVSSAPLARASRSSLDADQQAVAEWVAANKPKDITAEEPSLDGVRLSELEDLTQLAGSQGIPVMEAVEQQETSDEFQQVSWALEKKFPDTYGGMEFRKDGDTTWFGFSGDVPAEAIRLISALPGPSQIATGDYIPQAQWDSALSTASAEATKEFGTKISVALAPPSERTVEVTVHTDGSARTSQRATDETDTEVSDALEADGYPAGYKLTVEEASGDGGSLTDGVARGGSYLDLYRGNCTAGYIMRSSVGHRVGTAGHCAQPNEYGYLRLHHDLGGAQTAVSSLWRTYDPQVKTPQFDMGTYSTGNWSGYPTFYYNPGKRRLVEGAASSRYNTGVSVCFFGRATYDGYSCGLIQRSAEDKYFKQDNVTIRGVTRFATPPMAGDSGGPVYRTGWAAGIVTGEEGGNGYFTPVHLFEDYGLSVWVS